MWSPARGRRFQRTAGRSIFLSRLIYRWRRKYRGMQPEMAKELKTLQNENARLKMLVDEQALDMNILKEAAKGNW